MGRTAARLRRALLMEKRMARAAARAFEPSSPGFAEFARARASREAAGYLLRHGHRLQHSNGTAAAGALLRRALRLALLAALTRRGHELPTEPSNELLWEAALAGDDRLEPSLAAEARRAWLAPDVLADGGDHRPGADDPTEALLRAVDHYLAPLEEAARALPRARAARYLRWTLLVLIAAALIVGAVALGQQRAAPPNLARGKPTEASSLRSSYDSAAGVVDGITDAVGVHTRSEKDPWVTVDLGAPQPVAGVRVTNRSDCCQERALPLVLEVSDDGEQFVEVARRTRWFWRWSQRVRARPVRFVRLRVDGKSVLHLNEIEVYGALR